MWNYTEKVTGKTLEEAKRIANQQIATIWAGFRRRRCIAP